jgi:hypothetical protein
MQTTARAPNSTFLLGGYPLCTIVARGTVRDSLVVRLKYEGANGGQSI